jgi:hypothetical protein
MGLAIMFIVTLRHDIRTAFKVYRSKIDLEGGVAGTLAWYRKSGWL